MLCTIIINIIGDGIVDTIPSSDDGYLTSLIVEENSKISLKAIPNIGSKFDSWINCSVFNENICCLVINTNITITAKFVVFPIYNNLIIDVIGFGSVNFDSEKNICTSNCTYQILHNDCILLYANPDVGYMFKKWIGCNNCNLQFCSIIINQNKTITAIFVKLFQLIINISGYGKIKNVITSINYIGNSISEFAENTTVCLTPIPNIGYQLDSWIGYDYIYKDMGIIKLLSDRSVTVTFIVKNCILTIIINGTGFGHINVNDILYISPIIFKYNDLINLKVISDIGSKFEHWVSTITISYNESNIMFNILDDVTISCTFIKLCRLQIKTIGSGIISDYKNIVHCVDTCIVYFDFGYTMKLFAYPMKFNRFLKWVNCNVPIGNTCDIILNIDKTITAEFIKIHDLNINIIGNGDVSLKYIFEGISKTIICKSNTSKHFNFDDNSSISFQTIPYNKNILHKITGIDICDTGTCNIIITNNISIFVYFIKIITLKIYFFGFGYGLLTEKANIINCERKFIEYKNGQFKFNIESCTYDLPEGTKLDLTFIPSNCTNSVKWYNCNMVDDFKSIKIIYDIENYTDYIEIELVCKEYILSIFKDGSGSGIVEASDGIINCGKICYNSYLCNQIIQLTAIPDISSTFQWINPIELTETINILITDNIIKPILFNKKILKLSITIVGKGQVSGSKNEFSCSIDTIYSFEYGTNIDLIASAKAGYVFDKWVTCSDGSINICSLTLTQDTIIQAIFKIRQFLLTVNIIFDEDIDICQNNLVISSPFGIFSPGINTYLFNYESNITLTANNSKRCQFDKWITSYGIITNNICKFRLEYNLLISVKYKLMEFELVINIIGNGRINILDAEYNISTIIKFKYGSSIDINMVPDIGYDFINWIVDGNIITSESVTVIMDKKIIITITFEIMQIYLKVKILSTTTHSVSVISTPAGISCSSTSTQDFEKYNYNTTVQLIAIPISKFEKWSNGITEYKINIVLTTDQILIAYFKD
jgi:hypothetical protein